MSALNVWSLPDEQAAPGLRTAPGRVVLVAGGRQGVGASTVAALFALVAPAADGEVLLVEAGSHGVAHRMFGAHLSEGAADGFDTLDPQPTSVLPNVSVLSLGSADPRTFARRISHLRSRYALTVVDAGSRLQTVLSVAAVGIDQLLCVTTTDAIAGAGAYALIKALSSRFAALPVGVVVNRAPLWAASEIDHHLRQAAHQFLRRDIDVISHVAMDECLRAGMRAGMSLHEVASGSPAAVALYEVAQSLQLKQDQPSPVVYEPRPLQRRS